MAKSNMSEAGVESVFLTGGSLGVIIPKKFTDIWDIRKGDPINYIIEEDSIRFVAMSKDNPVIKALRAQQEKERAAGE